MGRLKKYKTEDELKEARLKWPRRYYWKNKEKVDARARNRYRKKVGKEWEI